LAKFEGDDLAIETMQSVLVQYKKLPVPADFGKYSKNVCRSYDFQQRTELIQLVASAWRALERL